MALDVATFYEIVIATILMAVTFLVLVLAFLYMIYAREEAPPTEKPKAKPTS